MKIQLEVLQLGRRVVCRESSKPLKSRKPLYCHPHADIHVYRPVVADKNFNEHARQVIMLKIQDLGLSVGKLTHNKRTSARKLKISSKQSPLFS